MCECMRVRVCVYVCVRVRVSCVGIKGALVGAVVVWVLRVCWWVPWLYKDRKYTHTYLDVWVWLAR